MVSFGSSVTELGFVGLVAVCWNFAWKMGGNELNFIAFTHKSLSIQIISTLSPIPPKNTQKLYFLVSA